VGGGGGGGWGGGGGGGGVCCKRLLGTGGRMSVISGSSGQDVPLILWNSRFIILFNFRPRVM